MSEFRFAEPQLIHGLWGVLVAIAALAWLDRRGGQALSRFVGEPLHEHLVSRPTPLRRSLRTLLLGLSAVFLVIALMRPQWGVDFVSAPRVGAEIMIALDVSKSMLAEDVAPNRLERAKAEIRDLLTYLEGDQVGLIAFAGRASVLSPLTPDFGFLRLVLDNAGVDSVTRGGTRLEEPIRKAVEGFGPTGDLSRVILLITDGEDHDSFPLDAAREARERGVRILSVGFGDEDGSEIVISDPETGARAALRDADGRRVMSRLDGDLLRELAVETDGAYVPAGTGVLDLESIFEAHIRPLMRAETQERGRTVHKDAFQWALLAAFLALIASVVTQASRTGFLVALLAVSTASSGAFEARAQAVSDEPAPAVPIAEEDARAADEERERLDVPEDPREAYNRGFEKLETGELDDAERLLEAARGNAGIDGEVRYRASYNLAWVDVRRADRSLENEPEEALRALERAADWLREAIALRPKNEDARRNLEIILQRAMALADSLAAREPKDVAAQLDALIERQRGAVASVRSLVEQVQLLDDPNAIDDMRRVFKPAALEERKILSDAAQLAELAGEERDRIEGTPEEERTPEDQMRAAQLAGVLHYLHRGREKIGQARTQLRQRQAERAYRRAAAGLALLKRARDQLNDPLRILDALVGDALQLNAETRALAASEAGVFGAQAGAAAHEEVVAPAWLTTGYLGETQDDVVQRSQEIQHRFEAGLGQAETVQDPEQQQVLEQVRDATPFVEQATSHFGDAMAHLEAARTADAGDAQSQAIQALLQARERFLDLKGLIEAATETQKQIDQILHPEDPALEPQLGEYAAALASFQQRNLERITRLGPMLTQERARVEAGVAQAEDPEAAAQEAEAQLRSLNLADEMAALIESSMQGARSEMAALSTSLDSLPAARASERRALQGLEALRRLFFSVIEMLRDTAERQVELNDRTEAAAPTQDEAPEDRARRLGPLAARQQELALVTDQIASTLHQQSFEDPAALLGPQAAQDPAAAEDAAQRLVQASELVLLAEEEMKGAAEILEAAPDTLDSARENQDIAVVKLAEALQLLQPPEQPQQDENEQDQQDQQDQQQQQQEQEPQESPEQGASDPEQMLQSVRDREAERHRNRNEQRGYEPVDKDW